MRKIVEAGGYAGVLGVSREMGRFRPDHAPRVDLARRGRLRGRPPHGEVAVTAEQEPSIMVMASETQSLLGAWRGLAYQAYQLGRKVVRFPILKMLIPKKLRRRVQSRMLNSVIDQLPDRR